MRTAIIKTLFIVMTLMGLAQNQTYAQSGLIPITVSQPSDFNSPGNSGPNAFSWIWHVDDARIVGDKIRIDASFRQIRDMQNENAQAGVIRVEVPFSELASFEFQALVEKWKLNDDAVAFFDATKKSGVNFGDLIAIMKFNVKHETKFLPEITLKGVVKTSTGADEDRRFTDSAGYEINLLFAKDIFRSAGVLKKIRVLTEVGFFAWDDGHGTQNDAVRYGSSLTFQFASSAAVMGIHGFTGWRNNGDKPHSLYIEGRKVLTDNMTGFTSLDVGMDRKSSNPYTFSAGIRLQLNRPYPKRTF